MSAAGSVFTGTGTYPAPADGWVCFHCGERFTTVNSARDHFGFRPTVATACTISASELKAELRELRVRQERQAKQGSCVDCGGVGARCDACFLRLVSGP